MKFLFNLTIVLVLAMIVGLGSVWLTVQGRAGIEQVRKGPWISWIAAGDPDADPYTRAMLARTGRIPLAAAEAIYFHALTDDDGHSLGENCTFRLRSAPLDARWWTITVTTQNGALIENPARRYGFNSQSVLREPNGDFVIRVGPQTRAGNWIPTGRDNQIMLTLRLYDTSMKTNGGLSDPVLPTILREDCQQ
ncbi:MAG: DUF1214 domain-containing protein [Rhizobiales bacterium]|nr:DUF1214 domain-containing protein [Hyphomicrobiales bacterium]